MIPVESDAIALSFALTVLLPPFFDIPISISIRERVSTVKHRQNSASEAVVMNRTGVSSEKNSFHPTTGEPGSSRSVSRS